MPIIVVPCEDLLVAGHESDAYPLPIHDFSEGQWWVSELDLLANSLDASNNLKRAVAVVHHLLKAIHATPQPAIASGGLPVKPQ